jgi:hypothetical protein
MKRRRFTRLGLACAVLAIAVCGNALGYFSSEGGGTAKGAVTSLAASTLTTSGAEGGKVTLSWTTVNAPDGGTVKYYLTRNGGEPSAACPGEGEPEAVTTCVEENLPVGTYNYKVFAVWSSWSSVSAEKKVEMKIGPAAKFVITGSTATPATGASVSLVVTAQDAAGKKVGNFTGAHELTFSGAQPSAEGKAPTVNTSAGVATPFGTPTSLNFSSGEAKVASSKNGVMVIYRPGEAQITATEGSITTPVPLVVKVNPTATKFVLTAEDTTPTAGVPDGLTIKAYDNYGNLSTTYTGNHNFTFTGMTNAPNGTVATVESSAGKAVNIGTATPIFFEEGVAEATAGQPGGYLTAYKYATTTQTLKAAEGSLSVNLALVVGAGPAATLTTTASATSIAANSGVSLNTTAKDLWGNVAVGFAGVKNLTYNTTGTSAGTSPNGNVPTVANSSGTAVPLNTETPINFVSGVGTASTNKNGYLRLYKAGTATIVVEGEELTPAPALNFTVAVSTGTKKLAINTITATAPATISSPCFFTCSVTGLPNAGSIAASIQIVDEYGNQLSNLGATKSVTVTGSGTAGYSITGSPMTVPASGAAITETSFTYKPPASGAFSNSFAIASSGYTGFSFTAKN